MKIEWLVFYGLTIFLATILISVWNTVSDNTIKEVAMVVSNLISGYLGYLVRQLEE